jgi:hypothetical protein
VPRKELVPVPATLPHPTQTFLLNPSLWYKKLVTHCLRYSFT